MFKAEHPSALDDAVAAIDEDDLFTFIYTSGTTGPPKGCMICHRNYYAMASVIDHLPGYVRDDDLMLLYLPLAHNFGRLMHLTGPYVGYAIAFLPDPLQTADALTIGPPDACSRAFRACTRRSTRPSSARSTRRRAPSAGSPTGRSRSVARSASGRSAGLPVGGCCASSTGSPTSSCFAKIRARLGGRLRTPISGGAPLVQEIAEFFDAIGIRIFEGYGLTECTTAATTNTPERWRFGTVGPALPGFELRIADDGELLIRSDTVFGGYYKDPDATAEVLGRGRLAPHRATSPRSTRTGSSRSPTARRTSSSPRAARTSRPQNLENDLKASKYISQALVVGDRRPYPAALVTLDAAEIGKWAAGAGDRRATWRRSPPTSACACSCRASSTTSTAIGRASSRSSASRSCPATSRLESGEVTPTLKLKRRTVMQHFAEPSTSSTT